MPVDIHYFFGHEECLFSSYYSKNTPFSQWCALCQCGMKSYAFSMKILGIDPGLATIGIGMVEAENPSDIRAIDWLTIKTKAGISLADRLVEIQNDLTAIIKDFAPDSAVIEKLFFSTNKKTAFDVAQARGVIMQAVAAEGVPITEITPMQLKSTIAGDGNAEKHQVQSMLVHMLNLNETPTPDDAADALGLAAYGALQMHTELHIS